ncbi:MAG: NAD-dependent epimerase/dehydratase family protein [Deltaproteobacteria bacterium]|nr:NAD-dependent epimerase/dehydratase family protein [Deltaproteobacteria bacterium]
MNILVTGAAGFIGSHLCERLLSEGHQVVGLDSFDSFLYDAATKERNAALLVGKPGFRLVRGDILDRPLTLELARGMDLVVHLAALAGVRPSIQDPPRYARVNVEGTSNILEACRGAGVQRLVFASSSSVYGAKSLPGPTPGGGERAKGNTPVAFQEDDPCLAPASPYAATKRAGELLCSTHRDLYGIGVCLLRFFTVYGPRQRPEMAIHKFTRLISARKPVTLFGDGTSARDYTFIDDIIQGTHAACMNVQPGDYTTYNLGGSRTTTLKTLVDMISSELGIMPIIDWQPDQPGDVPITFANVSRAGKHLGYEPKIPIEQGIRRFVEWFRKP